MKVQTFNDGVLMIYSVSNTAEDGDMPKDGLSFKFSNKIPYEERTVGISRFYAAKQVQENVNRILRIPRLNGISQSDKVIPIDGEQYDIVQVQLIKDIEPPSIDLSLQLRSAKYEIKGY